ncbi:MAG: cytochrome c3 family protein, partial [Calditrichaeota bacterium]|nr:cytochrome c3 family protein [Calditrichota bacterium]
MLRVIFVLLMGLSTFVFAQTNDDCMMCHSDPELTGLTADDTEISMFVDLEKYAESSHGGFACVDCHQDLEGFADYPHAEELELVNCGNCHSDVQEEYDETKHGLKFIGMEQIAPKCSDCHGIHYILPSSDPNSMTHFQNLPATCCNCHEARNAATNRNYLGPCVREEYLRGVHGKLIQEGFDGAPTCNTCHPAHSIRKGIDPQSKIYKMNIGNTCGECHIDALAEYSESIHSRALTHGIFESATCTDCHGEHQIIQPDSASLTAAHDACIECHTNEKLIRKYDLPESVVSTYVDSYHGLSIRLGREDAATCASCHGNHRILEASDPFSSVHENNLVETCAKCHENVNQS